MLKISDMRIGDIVLFGRGQGEKTLGEVIKVNRKKVKVKTLESRGNGRGGAAGAVWGVPPSLCVRANRDGEAVSVPSGRGPSEQSYGDLLRSALHKLTEDEKRVLKEFWKNI